MRFTVTVTRPSTSIWSIGTIDYAMVARGKIVAASRGVISSIFRSIINLQAVVLEHLADFRRPLYVELASMPQPQQMRTHQC
jgi:hypothetical protein